MSNISTTIPPPNTPAYTVITGPHTPTTRYVPPAPADPRTLMGPNIPPASAAFPFVLQISTLPRSLAPLRILLQRPLAVRWHLLMHHPPQLANAPIPLPVVLCIAPALLLSRLSLHIHDHRSKGHPYISQLSPWAKPHNTPCAP